MGICLGRGADLHMAQPMPLLPTVSLPFWYWLTWANGHLPGVVVVLKVLEKSGLCTVIRKRVPEGRYWLLALVSFYMLYFRGLVLSFLLFLGNMLNLCQCYTCKFHFK